MRHFVGWSLVATFLLPFSAGCPNSAEQRQEFLTNITEVQESENGSSPQVSRQTLADISTRLASGATTSTSSAGNPSANIGENASTQSWDSSLYVYNGVGDFGSGTSYTSGDGSGGGGAGGGTSAGDTGGNSSEGAGTNYFSAGNGTPPGARDALTWSGSVTGTDHEIIVGCCGGLFTASGGVSVFLNSSNEILGITMPGFATLPAMNVAVGLPGSSIRYEGVDTDPVELRYVIEVTTRSAISTASGFDVTLDVTVFAQGGSLEERGTAVHHVTGTFENAELRWTSLTSYLVGMFASASGQPDVLLNVQQDWDLRGTLSRN